MNSLVEFHFTDGSLTLRLTTSRLDASVARELREVCEAEWPAGVERLAIDLAAVEFIDSSGIGALLGLYKRLPAAHGAVPLLHPRRPVRNVIELLRLQRVFALEADGF
jgi:anti-sigma B factor antagonist